jgi:hypothetical protein
MLTIILGALIGALIQGSIVHPDCKARGFEPKACKVSKALDDAGKVGK